MPARVVDASVLGAAAFHEAREQEAAALLTGTEIHAPTLLAYELTNIARKKALEIPGHQQEIMESLETLLATDIRWVEPDFGAVLRLALETGLTAYDAAYLHVARMLGAELVTFDDRLGVVARRLLP
jgi:predicted nucleic acid-binding protein